jgi:hypothetical protein
MKCYVCKVTLNSDYNYNQEAQIIEANFCVHCMRAIVRHWFKWFNTVKREAKENGYT